MDNRDSQTKALVIGLAFVTTAALGLRLYRLDAESLWMDELRQVGYYGLPLPRVVIGAGDQAQPPLDYLIGAGLARVGLAQSDWWVRFPAACFGAGGVLLVGWWIGRIGGAAAGIAAALLLAVCPLHVAMSQEARPYTIFFFLALVTGLIFLEARRRHTGLWWGSFGLSLLALLLSRSVGPHVIVFGLCAYSLGAWVSCRRHADEAAQRIETQRQWAMLTTTAVAYALFNPLVGLIFLRHGKPRMRLQDTSWLERFGGLLSDAYRAMISGYSPRMIAALEGPTWILVAAGTIAAVGLVSLLRAAHRRRQPIAVLFATTMVTFPLLFAAGYTQLTTYPPKPQYLLLMAVPLSGTIALAADAVRKLTLPAGRTVSASVFAGIIGLIAIPMARASVDSLRNTEKRDWRGVLTYLRKNASRDDPIAAVAPHCVPQHCTAPVYGVPRYGWYKARFLATEFDQTLDLLSEAPWKRADNTLWIIGLTDVYEVATTLGYGLLPPPNETPPGVRVHRFSNLFLLEMSGPELAAERFMAGIDLLTRGLPDASGFVASNLYAGRYYLAQGDETRAQRCFAEACRQCRSEQERRTLIDEYLPETHRAVRGDPDRTRESPSLPMKRWGTES